MRDVRYLRRLERCGQFTAHAMLSFDPGKVGITSYVEVVVASENLHSGTLDRPHNYFIGTSSRSERAGSSLATVYELMRVFLWEQHFPQTMRCSYSFSIFRQ